MLYFGLRGGLRGFETQVSGSVIANQLKFSSNFLGSAREINFQTCFSAQPADRHVGDGVIASKGDRN